ncbi:BglG family transcription antiterminator [Cryobacterium luteum]|uniref:PRD domain-containing protein n=1 Tax=Cryobacterium luteum TaxID=1424661 RepID=A0A1H8C4S3_9MICO|nr:PRD domain-containing protein [Cryobacterium luteum]TFB89245.1 PRD domain-containing protein [Cryobacterium luteum]SEM89962.1 transcriptional antiterminator, BglG family [Cryobacterium luteum]
MADKQARMLDYLVRTPAWVTAGELADALGVTRRSVRSYVTNVKAAAHPLAVIESGPFGYRLNRTAYATFAQTPPPETTDSPQNRVYQLVRRLTDSMGFEGTGGLDLYALAADLFVSDSTIEADLVRLRALLPGSGLEVTRHGSIVGLAGSETDRRRLLGRMFREESKRGVLELAAISREFDSHQLGAFKTDLLAHLATSGYFINEFGTDGVLLHLAIAVDRARKLRPAASPTPPAGPPPAGARQELARTLAGLITTHFDVALEAAELDYLAVLLRTRVLAPGHDLPARATASAFARPEDLAVVRRIVARASAEYLVDLTDEDFIARLTLHVRNLIDRAGQSSFSRNPLARSMKTSYPMTYELAVYIASELQRHEQILINDDEIAYIAMHVGAHLEQQQRQEQPVRTVLVCPNYYDLQAVLRGRIEGTLGTDLDVVGVITRADVDWERLDAPLVLTTIEPPRPVDGALVIHPFLTEVDVSNIRQFVSRMRRSGRLTLIKDELLRFFDAGLFLRNFYPGDAAAMIRALGERMREHGIITQAYVDGALARERMSSTAFTDNLAVPHAMEMTALRTSIAIVLNDVPMDWGENRVTVVAMIAFSAAGRSSFQVVFDQFVEVFADRKDVQRLVHRSPDFASFIDELVHLMDQ